MALISCPECKAQVSDQAGTCPHCGFPLQQGATPEVSGEDREAVRQIEESQGKSHPILWTLGILIGLFVVFMAFGAMRANSPEGRAEATDRKAIELCRKDQNDELKDINTRRFVRGACDKMEAKFRSKYGVSP